MPGEAAQPAGHTTCGNGGDCGSGQEHAGSTTATQHQAKQGWLSGVRAQDPQNLGVPRESKNLDFYFFRQKSLLFKT